MNILEIFKMSVAMLAANKLQTSLTMLGIIMGNASVIATIGLGQGSQKLANEQLKSLGPNILFVMPGNQKAVEQPLIFPKHLFGKMHKLLLPKFLASKQSPQKLVNVS